MRIFRERKNILGNLSLICIQLQIQIMNVGSKDGVANCAIRNATGDGQTPSIRLRSVTCPFPYSIYIKPILSPTDLCWSIYDPYSTIMVHQRLLLRHLHASLNIDL